MRIAPALLLPALLVLAACGRPSEPAPTGARSRVQAVAAASAGPSLGDWCDVAPDPAAARPLGRVAAVAVAGGKPFEAPPPGRLIWLSLWATWCKPCVRELPLIVRFGDELRRDGLALDNWLLSLDDDSEALAAWLASHPELRGERSWRAEQPDAIGAWAQGYGVPADASIPMNFFVNGDGLVRCVRLGAIADGDYALIKGVARALAR